MLRFLLTLTAAFAAVQARAGSIISLNLCTDELLVLLAPEQITALSPLARDASLSVVAARAAAWPTVRPDAEAVLALRPDLILAGRFGAQAAVTTLRHHGLRVIQVDEPSDFTGVAAEVRQVAAAVHEAERGGALIAEMRARLAAIRPRQQRTAIYWEPRGYTAGPGSFPADVLRVAGYRNLGSGMQVGLEQLIAHPPDLLVTETAPSYPSLSTELLWHPALATLARRGIDPAAMTCPGPWSLSAVTALAQ